MAFGHRNFAVGTAYSKTEAVQAAIIALCAWAKHFGRCPGSASRSVGGRAVSLARRAGRDPLRRSAGGDGAAGGAVRHRGGVLLRVTPSLIRAATQAMPGGCDLRKRCRPWW
jgi:hypothetical protein